MVNTIDFKTKNEIIEKTMPKINGNNQFKSKTILAMDGGFSGVKGVSPNKLFAFPSYAKKAPEGLSIVGKLNENDLQLRDNKTGIIWLVGRTGEGLMDQNDVDSTDDSAIYTRYRYGSEMYKVIMSTGFALGLYGLNTDTEIYLQTGLPSEYLRDEKKLKDSLVGDYDISLKIGNRNWVDFKFSLDEEHIDVTEQPKGTLNSLVYDMGKVSKMAASILNSNVIVWDIGFGTEDIFSFMNHVSNGHKTYTDTAMKSVFAETIKRVQDKYSDVDVDVKVFELQKYLEDGQIPFFNVDTYEMEYLPFGDMLEEANKELCYKSIDRLMKKYDNMKDYQYLVVTGGTGESRFHMIQDKLKGLPKLQVVPGNINTPDISCIYSNVIGYYMFRHAKLMSEMKKAGYIPNEVGE